jgi:FtsH-binding integral membrane protein
MNTELVDFLSSFGGNTEKNGPSVANLSTQIRLKFLRKVYSILAVQLTLNTLVSGAILFIPSIKDFTMSK